MQWKERQVYHPLFDMDKLLAKWKIVCQSVVSESGKLSDA